MLGNEWYQAELSLFGSKPEIQMKPFQASQHLAQQHLCAIFCFKWEMHKHQFALMFLIMTFLELQHPCRSNWVFGLQRNNFQIMDCLGSTFPSGSPCVPRDQLYFGDVTIQSAQISAFPQFSQIFIFFKFFLALRTIPARADRNIFHSTLTFPDESTLFLSLRK